MDEMVSKKQVSNLVVLVVAMVLMANYFVSCENTNIGDVGSDHHHDHHNDGNTVKETHDLAPHHNGNRKMEAGGVIDPDTTTTVCSGEPCIWGIVGCATNCYCIPFFVSAGLCVGKCC